MIRLSRRVIRGCANVCGNTTNANVGCMAVGSCKQNKAQPSAQDNNAIEGLSLSKHPYS